MKLKAIIGSVLVATTLTLAIATPALALSLGVSPTQVELEVPGGGSTTTSVNVHYFSGDVDISLVDIPLRIEPSTIHVDASDNPVTIELTIYGNHSLDDQVYNGYIRFIAVSGGAATGGVQVIAEVTNIADGIAPAEEPVIEEPVIEEPVIEQQEQQEEPVVEEPAVKQTVAEQQEEPTLDTSQPSPLPADEQSGTGVPLIPILIGAGSMLALILLIKLGLAIRRWY